MEKTRNQYHPHEFTNLVCAEWMLPGEWKTLEVESDCNRETTSFVMATKLHPNAKDYVDFWGNVNPYGPQKNLVFVTITEFANNSISNERFSVTTGRHSHSDMTTTKFTELAPAMKHAVNEMVRTTKKFDKINKRKTQIWSERAIQENDSIINPVK